MFTRNPALRRACDSALIATIAAVMLPAAAEADSGTQAPATPTWVFFVDKGMSTEDAVARALDGLAQTYPDRAVARRALRGVVGSGPGVLFDPCDLPVVPTYCAAALRTGASLRVTSRWLNAISVDATAEQVRTIAALPCVARCEAVMRYSVAATPWRLESAVPATSGGLRGRLDYGLSTDQLAQINAIALHDAGFTGAGVIIGVLDTGFSRANQAFNDPGHPLQVVAEWDFVKNDGNTAPEPGDAASQHEHGTLILGTMGAYQPGVLVGSAYDAAFVLAKVEDMASEYPLEEDWFAAGLEFLEYHGADVATSSLVANWYSESDCDGVTSVMARAFNAATARGLHCLQGAGNSGHDLPVDSAHLVTPADAFDVLTCSSVSSDGAIAGFSSDGPTQDGRIKPEILARGVDTHTVDPFNPTATAVASGASLATPLAAGAIACLVQGHPTWSVNRMRGQVCSTAHDYALAGVSDPYFWRGYGVLDAYAAYGDFEVERGDLNCDGQIGFVDINPFVLALLDPAAYASQYPTCRLRGDLNWDGLVDYRDINPFVARLLGADR